MSTKEALFRQAGGAAAQEEDGVALSADSRLYPSAAIPDSGRRLAKPESIFDIRADLQQPRKLPSMVRGDWDGSAAGVQQVLRRWWSAAEEEIGAFDLDWLGEMDAEATRSDPDAVKYPLAASFITLARFADTILRGEVHEPIRITKDRQIIFGERRWLACHLLYMLYGEARFAKILAITEDGEKAGSVVWAQAAENNARTNLNAIGRARQYALLMMRAWEDSGATHKPIDSFNHEQGFYRQALAHKSLPHGYSQRIRTYLGVKQRSDISRLRELLTLDERAWTLGDDWNVPQDLLLRCAKADPATGLQMLEEWRHPPKREEQAYKQVMSSFRSAIRALNAGEAVEEAHVQQLEAWVAELRQRVNGGR